MMKRFLTVFLLFACIFPVAASAEDKPAQAVSPQQQLLQLLNTITSMQGDFVQTSYDQKSVSLQKQHGTFKVTRQGEFIWDIEKPYTQKIISDGKDIRLYDPDLLQLTIKPLDKKARVVPLLLFSEHNSTISETYNISLVAVNTFELVDKNKSSLFEKLQIHFEQGKPESLLIVDSVQQMTEVRFSNLLINQSIPASLFRFDPPKGTDVIDERQGNTVK
jgi:outer membrane lipoprotein carrier protein